MSSDNRTNQDSDVPNIIEADKFMAMAMDDISLSLTKLIDLSIKNQQTLSSLLDYTIKNEKRLASIQNELVEEADAGEYLKISGTVTISEFVILDTDTAPGHPAKGYVVINDGPNTIYVGHNMALSSIGPEIIDVTNPVARFNRILDGESLRFEFNRRKVKNIYILSTVGDSTYRGWLVW